MTPKPRARRGETLVEVLVALLVVSLSVSLLATMVGTSMSINAKMRQADSGEGGFYPALSAVESHAFDHNTDQPLAVRVTGGPTGPLELEGVYSYTSTGQGALTAYGKEG